MFDQEALEAAVRAWRSRPEDDPAACRDRGVPTSQALGTSHGSVAGLRSAMEATFDQLATDLVLFERSERMLGEGARRLDRVPASNACTSRPERSVSHHGKSPIVAPCRHVVADSTLCALGRDRTDADRAEDDEIASEVSDAIVESHALADTSAALDTWRAAERTSIGIDVSTAAGWAARRSTLDARAAFHRAEHLQRHRYGY